MAYGFSLNTLPIWTAASYMRFGPNDRPATRTTKYDVLIMVLDGAFRFTVNGEPVEITAGEYYLSFHDSKEEGNLKCDNPFYFYIHFKENIYDCPCILPKRGRFSVEEMLPLLDRLTEQIRSRSNRVTKASIIYQVLSLLKNSKKAAGGAIIDTVHNAIKNDPKKNFSTGELARLCGYSPNYFIQLFKGQTGKTPHAYINSLRIAEAKRLLTSDKASASQVAAECGFSDYTSFYRTFKTETGYSPGEWKRKKPKGT